MPELGDDGPITFDTQFAKMSSLLVQLAESHREEVNAALANHAKLKTSFMNEGMSEKVTVRRTLRKTARKTERKTYQCHPRKVQDSYDMADVESKWRDIPDDEYETLRIASNASDTLHKRDIAMGQSTEGIEMAENPYALFAEVAEQEEEDFVVSRLGTMQSTKTFCDAPSRSTSYIRTFRVKTPWLERTRHSAHAVPLKVIVENGAVIQAVNSQTSYNGFTPSVSRHNSLLSKATERACVIHPESKIRTLWTLASMFFLLYDFIVVPFTVCFDPVASPVTDGIGLTSTLFFTIDIPLNFLTGVRSYEHVEMQLTRIALIYLKSWFIFDLLIVVPEWVSLLLGTEDVSAGHVSVLRILRWARLVRLLRAARVMNKVKTRTVIRRIAFHFRLSKSYVQVARGCISVSALVLITVHLVSCFWYAIGSSYDNGWVQVNDLAAQDVGQSYVVSLRWTFSRLHGYMTNLRVETVGEMLVDALLVYGSLVLGCIYVSSMTTVWTTSVASKPWNLWNASVDFVDRHNISSGLSHKVQKALEAVAYAGAGEIAAEEAMLLEALPESLQNDLLFEARKRFLVNKPFFRDLALFNERALWHICNEAITSLVIIRDETVFAHSEACSRMYLVDTGKMLYKYGHLRPMRLSSEAAHSDDVTIIRAGDAVSEAILWTTWEHMGHLVAFSEAATLCVDPVKFAHTISKQDGPACLAARYAKHFVWRLNHCQEPNDLIQFDDLTYDSLDEDNFEGTELDHFVFISHYKLEAGTEATLIRDLLIPILRQDPNHVSQSLPSPVFMDSEDLSDLARIKEHVVGSSTLLILLTPGVFTRPWCLIELVVAIRSGVNVLPVEVQRPGMTYSYPDEDFYEDMLAGKIMNKAGVDLLASEGIQLEEVVAGIRKVFLKIAVPFSPHRAKEVREAELHMILKRCNEMMHSSNVGPTSSEHVQRSVLQLVQ